MTLQPIVDGLLHIEDGGALAHMARTFPGLHPDAFHLGLDLAMPVLPHPAAGPVAQALRQFIGQDMPVEESAHWPHIWQSKRKP